MNNDIIEVLGLNNNPQKTNEPSPDTSNYKTISKIGSAIAIASIIVLLILKNRKRIAR